MRSKCNALTRHGAPCPFRASRTNVYTQLPVCGHHGTSRRMQAAVVATEDENIGRCAAQTKRGYRCSNRGKVLRRGVEVCGVHATCSNLVLFQTGTGAASGNLPPEPALFVDLEEDCRICFEPLADVRVTTLPCGHRFCRHCARNHRRASGRNHRCPTCRSPVPN